MFTERSLPSSVETVRETHAPDALVLDCENDFETLPEPQAEELGLVVESLTPASYPDEWVPPDSPEILTRYASDEFTVGMPGDGSVVWTRQTDPPVVVCKPRLDGSPDEFARFLVAEALVEVGLDVPEHFVGFFEAEYPAFAAAARETLDPVGTYQLAAACYDAYIGLQTRETFGEWDGELFDAWLDAGQRLEPRVEELPEAMAQGQITFPDATELACSAIKHAGDLPAPFDALNATLYLDHGPEYAVRWAEKALDSIA